MQKKLCRPVPLEMIGSLTVATLRELAAEAGCKGSRSAAGTAPEQEASQDSPPDEAAPPPQSVAAPAPAAEKASNKVHDHCLLLAMRHVWLYGDIVACSSSYQCCSCCFLR
jgi:hypothetical protein